METLTIHPGQTATWEREPGSRNTLLNLQIENIGRFPLSACRAAIRYTPGTLWFPQQTDSNGFASPNGLLLSPVLGSNIFSLAPGEIALLRYNVGGIAAIRFEFESGGNARLELSHQLFQFGGNSGAFSEINGGTF